MGLYSSKSGKHNVQSTILGDVDVKKWLTTGIHLKTEIKSNIVHVANR